MGDDSGMLANAFAQFVANNQLNANQIDFVNLVIDHLAENGVMEGEAFYESPFVDVAATGPESLFGPDFVDTLIQILATVRSTATTAVVLEVFLSRYRCSQTQRRSSNSASVLPSAEVASPSLPSGPEANSGG